MGNETDKAAFAAAIAAMRRWNEGAWWVVRGVALAGCVALPWCILKFWSWTVLMLLADVMVYGSAVGLAALFLHTHELAARKRLARALAAGEPLPVKQPWVETLLAVATIVAGGWFVVTGAQLVQQAERQQERLEAEARLQRQADASNTGGVVTAKLDLANPTEQDLASLRTALDNALRKSGYAVSLAGETAAPAKPAATPASAPASSSASSPASAPAAPGTKAIEIVGPVKGSPGEWHVKVAYSEPLYAVSEAQSRWVVDARARQAYAFGGAAIRFIREVAPTGTPVPSRLRLLANGNIDLQAEGVENPSFPSGFASHFKDAALVVEGSAPHKTLRHVLDRVGLLMRQLAADKAAARDDPVAKARYKENLYLLDKDLPTAAAAVLKRHYGKIVEALPESWDKDFGTLPEEQRAANAAIDTAALLKDINRRLSIAGETVAFTACEVLERAATDKTDLYRLRATANQALWQTGDLVRAVRSPANRQLSTPIEAYRPVTRVAAAGEPFEVRLTLNNAQQRDPDRIRMDVGEGRVFEAELCQKNRAALLLVAGSPAEAAMQAWGQRALALEQALYEDRNRRRNDPAAKARYAANGKAQRAARKALDVYAKPRKGKIHADLPGLPRVPDPVR